MKRIAGLLLCATLSANAADVVVTLQVRPDAKMATLRKIARLGEPRDLALTRDMWAYEILREEYGNSHWKLRLLFADYNGQRQRFKRGETVKLPAAPVWLFDVKQEVNDSTTVQKYLEVRMGVAGPINLGKVAEKSGVTRSALEKLKPGKKIVLPYVAEAVSVDVDESKLPKLEKAIEQLKASDDAVQRIELSEELMLTPYASLSSADASCPVAQVPPQTHCNVEKLDAYPVKQRTIVAVIDSGVPGVDARFNFWKNPGEFKKKPYTDDDDNKHVDDVIGTNFIVDGFPRDDVTAPGRRNHGTHVAGLASCRVANAEHQAAINERVELMILKAAREDGSVEPAALMNAAVYAMDNGARIVNLSLEVGQYQEIIEFVMKKGTEVLFVVAAGNGVASVGKDLGSHEVYPAKLSGRLPNVMSVAAHDANGQRTCFSNFGGDIVDIAAPGLGVQSTVEDGQAPLSGTSQAAPLVTVAAALLRSCGIEDPVKIRERLILSADFKASLRGQVRSEGTLNVAKALAYDRDLVVAKSGTYEGELIGFTAVGTVPAASIKKVINGYDLTKPVKIVTATGSKFANAIPDVTIRLRAAAGDVTIAGSDIIEIIPRLR